MSTHHLADTHLADTHLADMHLADTHLADMHLADTHLAFKGKLECLLVNMCAHPMEYPLCTLKHVHINCVKDIQMHWMRSRQIPYQGVYDTNTVHIKLVEACANDINKMKIIEEKKRRYFIEPICYAIYERRYAVMCTRFMQHGSLRAFMESARTLNVEIPASIRLSLAAQCVRAVAVLHHKSKHFSAYIELKNFYLDSNMCVVMQGLWGKDLNKYNSEPSAIAYVAPELFMLHSNSQMSDVYALGVVLLELLSGVPAYSTHNIKSGNTAFGYHDRTRAKLEVSTNDMVMVANRCGMELLESAHRELILQMLHDTKKCRPTALEVYRRLAPEVYEANRGIFSC